MTYQQGGSQPPVPSENQQGTAPQQGSAPDTQYQQDPNQNQYYQNQYAQTQYASASGNG